MYRDVIIVKMQKDIASLNDSNYAPVKKAHELIGSNASLSEIIPVANYLAWAVARQNGTLGTYPKT